MSTVKVSVTLDAGVVDEVKKLVGERGFSRFLNETLFVRLQHMRLEKMLDEMDAELGPVPDTVRDEARREMDWRR